MAWISTQKKKRRSFEGTAAEGKHYESARYRFLIHTFDDFVFHGAEGADVGDAVPGILIARAAAEGFVALEEAGHEEFLGEGGQLDAAPGVVLDGIFGFFGVHDAEDGAGLRGVVGDRELIGGFEGDGGGEAHEGVAVGGVEADAVFQDFLDDEADVLRGHGGAADEAAADADVKDVHLFSERFEELRGGEDGRDFAVLQQDDGLIDDVVHVLAGDVELLVGDEFFDEAGVEVNEVAGAAAVVGEVFDGEAEAAGAGGADHDPGFTGGEVLVIELVGEFLIIDAEVVPADALFGHAGGAAGFEDVVGFAFEGVGDPDVGLEVAEVFVLEVGEVGDDVGVSVDFAAGVEVFSGPVEPEGAAGFGGEVPVDDFADVGVELGLGFFGSHGGFWMGGKGGEGSVGRKGVFLRGRITNGGGGGFCRIFGKGGGSGVGGGFRKMNAGGFQRLISDADCTMCARGGLYLALTRRG